MSATVDQTIRLWIHDTLLEELVEIADEEIKAASGVVDEDDAAKKLKKVLAKRAKSVSNKSKNTFSWIFAICNPTRSNLLVPLMSSQNATMAENMVPDSNTLIEMLVQDESSKYNGRTVKLSSSVIFDNKNMILMANPGSCTDNEQIPDDLVDLTHLHEPAIVHMLQKRFEQDTIYTSTGPILLSVNPLKDCSNLYSDETMDAYWERGIKQLKKEDTILPDGLTQQDVLDYVPPHIFATADNAFVSMMRGLKKIGITADGDNSSAIVDRENLTFINQAILVSGDSGSGKTYATKHMMKYLATISLRKALKAGKEVPSSMLGQNMRFSSAIVSERSTTSMRQSWTMGGVVEEKILSANPILESFGNARTMQNDNSSRFGKFVDLHFKQTGSLIGASIKTYLLEKLRLVYQGIGERNFHVFYELLSGMTDLEKEEISLKDLEAKDFRITSMSGTYDRRDQIDDSESYCDLELSMGEVGFEREDVDNIFSILSAILHMSNLNISASSDETNLDIDSEAMKVVQELLKIDKEQMNKAICYKTIQVVDEICVTALTESKARKRLEALMKSIYNCIFNFLVEKINSIVSSKTPQKGQVYKKVASIGVIDIYGFEIFPHNSYEQLCINYCNEALQQHFDITVFENTQKLYVREGLQWERISFPDNKDALELIDSLNPNSVGIIPLLNDMCKVVKTTDTIYAQEVYKRYSTHTRFTTTPMQQANNEFVLNHYAGPVCYDMEGFIEKNRDEFPKESIELVLSSKNKFLRRLGKMMEPKGNVKTTLGEQIVSQLKKLTTRLEKMDCHFVRCLRPNDMMQPGVYNKKMVSDQLGFSGVLQAVQMSRLGFSQRYGHKSFTQRYRILDVVLMKNNKDKGIKEICGMLVESVTRQILSMDKSDLYDEGTKSYVNSLRSTDSTGTENNDGDVGYFDLGLQMGDTQVFIRQDVFQSIEKMLLYKMGVAVSILQKFIRNRLLLRKQNQAATAFQTAFRRHQAILQSINLRGSVQIINSLSANNASDLDFPISEIDTAKLKKKKNMYRPTEKELADALVKTSKILIKKEEEMKNLKQKLDECEDKRKKCKCLETEETKVKEDTQAQRNVSESENISTLTKRLAELKGELNEHTKIKKAEISYVEKLIKRKRRSTSIIRSCMG